MFKHNLLISYRNLIKDKGFTFINIGGLALGVTMTMVISLWIWDEMAFNKYHETYDEMAIVLQNQNFNGKIETWRGQARQLGDVLRNEYGDNFKHVAMTNRGNGMTLEINERRIDVRGQYMEKGGPHLLGLKMLEGKRDGLKDLNSVLVSESVATALFGTKEVIGETIKLDGEFDIQIAGVYENIPSSSNYTHLDCIGSWDFFLNRFDLGNTHWGNSWFRTLVQINDGLTIAEVSEKIKNAKAKHVTGTDNAKYKPELFLHPMSNWKLYAQFENGKNIGGDIKYIWMFGAIGLFVLLLACINFINLSTARSERRAKEVGVRKAIGSPRSQLLSQFFSESYLVVGFAFALALLLTVFTLPMFNEIADKELRLPIANPWFWLAGLSGCLLTGFLSGIYPALYLSSFKPVKVLNGTFKTGRGATIPRKVLVVFQFTVSVALIITTITILQQIQYVKDRPIGYENTNLITVSIQTDDITNRFETFRNDMLNTKMVEEIALSESPVTFTGITNGGLNWVGKDPNMADEFVTLRVTHDFGKVINWKIIEGRDFSKAMKTDSAAFVINEAAVKYMELQNPIGETIDWDGEKFKIIGVAENMITQSPYDPIQPTIFFINFNRANFVNIKVRPEVAMNAALSSIEKVFFNIDPENTFDYSFADADYSEKFKSEIRVAKLASIFTLLAILISCLGAFGLAAYFAERRAKEIGIRKVLGASVFNVWKMLSTDFIKLVLLGCLIAIPIANYFLSGWLQNFEYRIEVSWWIFLLASLLAIIIAIVTVSFQALKAAILNPVNALSSE